MADAEGESQNCDKQSIEIALDSDAEWLATTGDQDDLKVDPPELPPFLDALRVGDISTEIEKQLALTLDLPGVGNSLRNWEWLASVLGMTWEEIKYLQVRAQHPSSPTSVLLWRYRERNLGEVLRLVRDSLNRYDVIVQLLPMLFALEETLKLDATDANHKNKATTKCDGQDSGIVSCLVSGSSFIEPSSSSRFNKDMLNLHASTSSSNNACVDRSCSSPNMKPKSDASCKPPHILVTFYEDNELHVKKVNWLCKNLRRDGAKVETTEEILQNSSQDLAAGFTTAFNNAKHIVVVCSTGYRRCVEFSDNANTDVHTKFTLFIYKLMFSEYAALNCKNTRFRPVLFEEWSLGDVPAFFKNTIVYQWPEQHEKFMKAIFSDN